MKARHINVATRHGWLKASLGLAFCVFATTLCAAPRDTAVPAGFFKGATLKYMKTWYPHAARSMAFPREGWVIMRFMVSPQGKAYDATVVSSVGGKLFERTALKQLKGATFNPATLDGKPISSMRNLRFRYELKNMPSGVTFRFYRPYKRAVKALNAGHRSEALAALKALQPQTLQDDAYFSLAEAQYSGKWGSPADQLTYIRRFIDDDEGTNCLQQNATGFYGSAGTHIATRNRHCLPSGLYRSALLESLELDINTHRLAEALEVWKQIKRLHISQAKNASLVNAIARIKQIKAEGLRYAVDGRIVGRDTWAVALLEPKFSVAVSTGKISEVALFCQRAYVGFPFNPQLQYTVHGKYGKCELELVGAPSTRFKLYQFR